MRILSNSYPDGKRRALTMSYDDGQRFDRQLVHIFNETGLKGSFHLNSGYLGDANHVTLEELPELYRGHEISVHTVTHPYLQPLSNEVLIREVMEDRRKLESVSGYPVRGMSYPYGDYNDRVIGVLRTCGIVCSRTTKATGEFKLPADFLAWHPTCHHRNDSMDLADKFFAYDRWTLPCFFVWGHSYEFDRANNWDLIEKLARRCSGDPDTWYATNIEIYDYITALRGLQYSVDASMVHNPAAIDVWVTADGDPVRIPAGQTVKF